ncbi:type II toxin-antitoxin system VapC family toxin [Bosea sp. (in: a-proteobacteria)]|uniref:type II toxin-antitoxin system VapC family toxin n=1 Tax=Bosea sp. (in: a-proteobacteria) TaxID=1871050 RepID=UPI0035617283
MDASIVVAAFSPDEGDARAIDVLAPLLGGGSHAPDLWAIEIANVLMMKTRRNLLNAAQADAVWRSIRGIPLELHRASIDEVEESVRPLARRHGLSGYDACYLNLARKLGFPLGTLDGKLRIAAAAEGLTVL